MALFETSEVLKVNDKIHTFVLINPNQVDDVDLFVVQPPPALRDPAHRAPIGFASHLCNACRSALEYLSFWLNAHKSEDKEAAEKLPAACLVHAGAKTLQEGDEARCHLCVLLMANLRVRRLAMRSINQSNIEMCWQSKQPKLTKIHFTLTHRDHPRSSSNYWNILKFHLRGSSEFDEALLGFTEASQGVERHSNTGSVQARANALQWLDQCRANEDGKHDQCNRPSGDWLPTRLLDVTSAIETSSLKLVTPLDNPDAFVSDRQYVTLSHCWGAWGGAELPVLTTGNLTARLKDGLSASLLPQTFKDAVQVAHWFKVRWLWIDSLCILQDSDEDWQKEAVMMYDVYKNAILNISADDSPNARWGCFRDRDPLAVILMNLHFPGQEGGTFWLVPDSQVVFASVTDSPLAKRGWVFQERQLSKRVLHFTSSELIWECCAKAPYFASETFPGGTPFETAFNGKPKFQAHTNLSRPGNLPELYTTWGTICKEYSAKVFSHMRDKPVALSGLAQEFEAAFPDDMYMAGIWRSTLPESLLWESSSSSTRLQTTDYIAPSWSWLSIDGPISRYGSAGRGTYSLVDVLSIATTPVIPSKPTALLKSASIELRCFLRPVEVRPDYEKKPWYMMAMGGGKRHRLLVKDDDGRETGCIDDFHTNAFHYSFDADSDENSGPEVVSGYFLPLCMSQPDETHPLVLSGLLVEAVGEDGKTYRRVGVLCVYGSNCLRIKYKMRDAGQESLWGSLLRLLGPTHKSLERLREDVDSDEISGLVDDDGEVEDTGADEDGGTEEKLLDGGKLDEGEDREDKGISETSVELEMDNRDNGKGKETIQPRVDVDLDSVDALERLYTLDIALDGSELEAKFEKPVQRQIVLI